MSPTWQLIIVFACVALAAVVIARRAWRLLRAPVGGCGSGGCGSCANSGADPTGIVERPLVQIDLSRPKQPR